MKPNAPVWRALLLDALLLGLLTLLLTVSFYAVGFQAAVYADDRIRGLFVGFQDLERAAEPYRWSAGAGSLCLPAPGLSRPRGALELRLLGSAITAGSAERAIDQATLHLAEHSLALAIAPESRAYRLLVPPAAQGGPLCLGIASDTVDPGGNGRLVGVGLRSVSFHSLAGTLPPPAQLLANLWLSVGGYWLLRQFGLGRALALPLVLAVSLLVGLGLLSGAARLAPDLPFWSGFAAVALALSLAARQSYVWAAPRLSAWQRELLGTGLILLLLSLGWQRMASLEGYLWPFPLMARQGIAFGWGLLPAVTLFLALLALQLRWLRAPAPPPASLAIGVAWLAAATLPATLKAGLRGWEALFQTFGQQGNYIEDVPRVGNDPLGFLRDYVAMMPELALHNKTHPPSATLFLWTVERLFGPGPELAAWAIMAIAALGVWPTYRLAAALLDRRAATFAAAAYALLPAFMIYAATSLDALFATVLAWAIYALYAALVIHDGAHGSPRTGAACCAPAPTPHASRATQLWFALAAGLWIALGLLLSFTTLMLAFVVLALTARRVALGPRRPADVARWAVVGAVIAGGALLPLAALWAVSGYDSLAAFFSGIANNRLDVTARISPLGLASYLFFLAVNTVAYGWFLGPWLLYRLGRDARRQIARSAAGVNRPADALGVGLAALLLGMLLSGLFYREIERIWLFSHILSAALLSDGMIEEDHSHRRQILAALLLISLFVHSVIFRVALRVSW